MVVLAKGELDQIAALLSAELPMADVPSVDLSAPAGAAREAAARALVAACEEDGFFRVTGHGVSMELVRAAEAAAAAFFAMPQANKEVEAPTLGYGSKQIGGNGDLGWVEYLLLGVAKAGGVPAASSVSSSSTLPCAAAAASAAAASSSSSTPAGSLRGLLDEYSVAVRRMACAVLELMEEGLGLVGGGELARLVARADSDCMLRVNHYPPRPAPAAAAAGGAPNLTGFGEHTDPQIISVLRSNGTSGLEVARRDGAWAAVPADRDAFFINVGDTLQVLTNGRFRSVRHRVVVNSERSRVSMIFFGGPPPDEKLAPLPELLGDDGGGRSRYREFTWTEFKASGCRTRLDEDRLARFEN